MSQNSHGGKRQPGEGKKLGSTCAERLAKAGAKGAPSVCGFFGGGASSASGSGASSSSDAPSTVGSVRVREPGGTPSKQDATRQRAAAAEGAGTAASVGEDIEVEVTSESTWAERDEAARAAAIPIDVPGADDVPADGAAAPEVKEDTAAKPEPSSPPRTFTGDGCEPAGFGGLASLLGSLTIGVTRAM